MDDKEKIVKDLEVKQLVETISTFRTQYTLMTQAFSVLLVGNLTILGWAFNNQKAGLILLSSLFPVSLLILKMIFTKQTLPIFYTGILLEKKLGNDSDLVFESFLGIRQPHKLAFIKKCLEIEDKEKRFSALRNYGNKYFHITGGITSVIAIISIIGQIFLSVILMRFFCWNFF
jgi:hypothetical protein